MIMTKYILLSLNLISFIFFLPKNIDANNEIQDSDLINPMKECIDKEQGNIAWISDGYCDEINNNEACGFDGGDCCPNTCKSKEYDCIKDGGTCLKCKDPIASYSLWINGQCDCTSLGRFQCDNGDCINEEKLCNGTQDCTNNEDESQCNYVTSPNNLNSKFVYNNGLNIELSWEDTEDTGPYNIYQWIRCGDNICHSPFEKADTCPMDCDLDNNGCNDGFITSCNNPKRCCPKAWLSDGYCDSGDNFSSCNLECYSKDGGDCDINRGESVLLNKRSERTTTLDQWVKIGSSNSKSFTSYNIKYDTPYKIAVTKIKPLTENVQIESKRSKPTYLELKKTLKILNLPKFNNAKTLLIKENDLLDLEWSWTWDLYENVNDHIIDCDGNKFMNRDTNLFNYDCFVNDGFCIDKNNDQTITDFLGDQVCDDGFYGINLFCSKFSYDCGDCSKNSLSPNSLLCDENRKTEELNNNFFHLKVFSFQENRSDNIYKFETTQTHFITPNIEKSRLICAEISVSNHLGQISRPNRQFCFLNNDLKTPFAKGDFNLDHTIDILDVLTLEQSILLLKDLSYFKTKELDQNRDNKINIFDIQKIIQTILE